MTKFSFLFVSSLFLLACNPEKEKFDASGSFESDEVIVSSQLGGQLTTFRISEGDSLAKGEIVGTIDSVSVSLQKQQVEASIRSLSDKTVPIAPQIKLLEGQLAVQESKLENLMHEHARIERLIKADAATGKQLDDLNAQIDVIKKQMSVTKQQINVHKANASAQNRGILSERQPLQKRAAQLQEQLDKSSITNPVTGTVITKYAEQGEITSPGKALYKIADLSVLTLRAYITGSQLASVRLNQHVKVLVDSAENAYRRYDGAITWISDKAEFTPKTIQTKEERANLVYAIKIRVKNDGYLKIGMFGEVQF